MDQGIPPFDRDTIPHSAMIDALMAFMPDYIFFKDRASRFLACSGAHARMMGFSDPSQVVGKTDFELFPPDEAQGYYREEQKCMDANTPVINRERRVTTGSGGHVWITEHKLPFTNPSGQVIGLMGISRDVTAVKEGELERERFIAELQQLRGKEQEYLKALRSQMKIAARIQADFLPRQLPEVPGWKLASYFQPALEVAGDFYDAFLLPDGRLCIAVSDICGKGVGAAIFMALVRSLIRALACRTSGADPGETLSVVNDYILRNHHHDGPYMYACAFVGVVDPATGILDYVNAGLPPPCVLRPGSPLVRCERTGPALGIDESARYTSRQTVFQPGDLLFAFSDGVLEARDGEGRFLGRQELYALFDESGTDPDKLTAAVCGRIALHLKGAPLADDITMLALKPEQDRAGRYAYGDV